MTADRKFFMVGLVETVQFFIFAPFHAPENSAVEKNNFLDC